MINKLYTAEDLGRQIRAERKALGLTQQQVAKLVGITRQTVLELEQGGNVSLHVLMRVLTTLGKTLTVTDSRLELDQLGNMFEEEEEEDEPQKSHPVPRG